MSFYIFGLVTYGSRCIRQVSLRRFPGSNVLTYYVIIIFIYNYTSNRVTSICIDLSKIKLFVFVFVPHSAYGLPNTSLYFISATVYFGYKSYLFENNILCHIYWYL